MCVYLKYDLPLALNLLFPSTVDYKEYPASTEFFVILFIEIVNQRHFYQTFLQLQTRKVNEECTEYLT